MTGCKQVCLNYYFLNLLVPAQPWCESGPMLGSNLLAKTALSLRLLPASKRETAGQLGSYFWQVSIQKGKSRNRLPVGSHSNHLGEKYYKTYALLVVLKLVFVI